MAISAGANREDGMRDVSLDVEWAGLSEKLRKDQHLRMVHAFVQGAKWMSTGHHIPSDGWIIVEARRYWNRGILGSEGIDATSSFVEDFSEGE